MMKILNHFLLNLKKLKRSNTLPNLRRRKLIGDYIPYRRLIVYYAVFEREGVVCEWL